MVSRPQEDVANTSIRPTLASRRRSQTESSAVKGVGKQAAVDWVGVNEDSPGRRRRQPKRNIDRSSAVSSSRGMRNTESVVGGFLPKLSRILELSESKATSRQSRSGSDARKHRDQSIARRHRYREDVSVEYRRPVRHKSGGVHRRSESGFKVNPSLLSVLSSLTRTSGRSSDSSTTITQQSYDRRGEEPRGESRALNIPETERNGKRPSSPNVFDFMDATSVDEGHGGRSTYSSSSSSSSQYEPSEAGSSERSGTPSSQSTFPSPTATRHSSLTGSVAELRRKYDSQYATSISSGGSVRSGSRSPEVPGRSIKRLSKVRNDLEERDELDAEAKSQIEVTHDGSQRSSSVSSRSSRPSRRHAEKQSSQEDAMRQHLASSQHIQHHMIDPVYGQHRSHSASSHGSAGSARAYAQVQAQAQAHYMAMQQYQYPSPQAYAVPPQAMNGHVPQVPERIPAPDAPDLSQRTITGYEQLATELASEGSGVVPIYRKFEYLNHRILLHLQDELSEMEEHLRRLDEIIAQMEPQPSTVERAPASRRGDAFNGSQIHHQRTELLGRIFLKTEQYNRAMSSFATMAKDSCPAEKLQVIAYQHWLKEKAAIHEIETRFLQSEKDLIQPGKAKLVLPPAQSPEPLYRPTKHAALTCLPVALMLPLLLFALIPTLTGRLVVTTLIACGTFMVAATTRIRHLMPAREWAVCGAAYVLLMAAIAGCIPQHGMPVGPGSGGAQVTYWR
ncbi:hypothetical protein CLAFUW4_09257 [Fulvia fulva]|nr:hypothetical protein CLAFUR4_09263 [Fulvia fulva]KAK4614931.1 hypothetical protein CLAFUR0_09255 [Fulvia fulva]WPV20248.1 hypothetical protein CLAFUW4_09257 [Fulvia fulva]WPV35653.1 hypothetical protein CLAFUW7_09258 [Fulvia fulva]